MENKYYKPEIEEFHVGFEYETKLRSSDLWGHRVVTLGRDYLILNDAINNRCEMEVRVKYLDREDIESFDLGAWSTGKDVNRYSGNNRKRTLDLTYKYNGNIFLFHRPETNQVEIYKSEDRNTALNMPIIDSQHLLFKGTIKNKSELKKILKWIGV